MTRLTKDVFLEHLAVYGADFNRWPQARRVEAQDFLAAADKEVRTAFDEEAAFDAFIAPVGVDPVVSVDLETALLAGAPSPSTAAKHGGLSWLTKYRAPRWASAAFAAACLMGGAGTGYGVALAESHATEAETLLAFAVVSPTELFDEWTSDAEAIQ